MAKFIVKRKEIHIQKVGIEAANAKMALELVTEGDGEDVGDTLYYGTFDPEDWEVEVDKG